MPVIKDLVPRFKATYINSMNPLSHGCSQRLTGKEAEKLQSVEDRSK